MYNKVFIIVNKGTLYVKKLVYVTFDESNLKSVEVEMYNCTCIMKNTILEDKDNGQDQGKNKEQCQEEDQSQTETNKNKETSNVHRDLPKECMTTKDHQIQNVIGDIFKGSQLDAPLIKYVTL